VILGHVPITLRVPVVVSRLQDVIFRDKLVRGAGQMIAGEACAGAENGVQEPGGAV